MPEIMKAAYSRRRMRVVTALKPRRAYSRAAVGLSLKTVSSAYCAPAARAVALALLLRHFPEFDHLVIP
jgi:hypothetical protein